jgi:4-amino-4-deoxy-L-arabinose transferase-like glycosyltransferase
LRLGERRALENALPMLFACLFLLTAFRLAANYFANTELFFDEAQYWFWSRELAFGYYSKPPLIGWIIRGATEICGPGEACIRAPSALFHAGSALLVFAMGRRLYDERTGFWSAIAYATLPGVSLSSSLISTDAPLLFFVALALYAFIGMRESRSWVWAVLFGAALGFGFLAKYAMVYFLLCLALWLVWSKADRRKLLSDPRFYAGLALGLAILAPNLIWNARNGFATFAHTADNAKWDGSLLHPVAALEFIGGQFGVFGPVLFAAYAMFVFNWLRDPLRRESRGDAARLLLAFSLPVLLLMTGQAMLSRAHANWAAFAYVAAVVLVVAALLREGWAKLFRVSLAIHLAAVLLIAVGSILAGRVALPGGDPYARLLGWKAIAQAAGEEARAGGFRAIAVEGRSLAAELLYYLRDENLTIVALRGDGAPRDHFELTRPLTASTPRPVLLVGLSETAPAGSRKIGSRQIAAGAKKHRTIHFHALDGAAARP